MDRNESWLRRQVTRLALFFETAHPVIQGSVYILAFSLFMFLLYLAGVKPGGRASGEYGVHDPRIKQAQERAKMKDGIVDLR